MNLSFSRWVHYADHLIAGNDRDNWNEIHYILLFHFSECDSLKTKSPLGTELVNLTSLAVQTH